MSKSVEIIACPVCRTELSLEQITGHLDDERAFARLVALTVPMARSVVQYIGLFAPPRQVRRLIDESGRDIRLEIDGGVKVDNIREIAEAGADMFVAGSAIFGKPDYKAVIDQMRAELAHVRR